MKKVLILGAGLVVKPMVDYLLGNGFSIMIASPMKERADEMIKGNSSGKSLLWSMDEPEVLHDLVKQYDITVSLLPPGFHPVVAKVCLKSGKPLVTTSYVSPEMKSFDSEAMEKGIILLNEAGLDPGIDHMSAMKIIDGIHGRSGKVDEFYSICGALPAPEAADNPMKYKFTWSPLGVIRASRNGAHYLKNGKSVTIEPVNLFKDRFGVDFPGIGELEVYPNRDSVSYIDIYGIPETKTMYRGTFRFKGWCETLDLMKSVNMLDETPADYSGFSFIDFINERVGLRAENTKSALCSKLNIGENNPGIKSLEWLGFFSDSIMGYEKISPFDIVAQQMIPRMALKDNERDMVVLQHIFHASYPGGKKEKIISSMVDYGTPATSTSIARTVALPASIAVKLILENKIALKGVYRPVVPEIYEPVLKELESFGIQMIEKIEILN
jgi:saccharopine dehydrogenase-like NADP-dependent oxidoreductase